MFSFGKAKNVINLVIDEYAIRMVENNGKDFSSIKILAEKALPAQMIENGKLVDELEFYNFMKEVVDAWGIKDRSVRFYAPDALIIMRDLQITDHVIPEEVKQYITMEIGHTIHFPFNDPIFDVYNVTGEETVEQVTVLAAPEDEILKYTNILRDVKLKPVAVDIQALGNYRYFHHQYEPTNDRVYLFLELNLTSVNISIFSNHYMEFLRYQSLNVSAEDWQPTGEAQLEWTFTGDKQYLQGLITDQMNEIGRIMNFYEFSIHQGEKVVTDIVLLGDLPNIAERTATLSEQYAQPVTILSTESLPTEEQVSPTFIPALGLALKGAQ